LAACAYINAKPTAGLQHNDGLKQPIEQHHQDDEQRHCEAAPPDVSEALFASLNMHRLEED
jgi:hypothetical protein